MGVGGPCTTTRRTRAATNIFILRHYTTQHNTQTQNNDSRTARKWAKGGLTARKLWNDDVVNVLLQHFSVVSERNKQKIEK